MASFDVIVVGGGHAGIEASCVCTNGAHEPSHYAECRIKSVICRATRGRRSGKGHLVKEIDALGGEMAKAADETGIQFRQLNTGKGPAVRSSRAQVDRQIYRLRMKKAIEDQKGSSSSKRQ